MVSFFHEFCRRVNTLCLFGMSVSLRFERAVVCVHSSEGRKEGGAPPYESVLATDVLTLVMPICKGGATSPSSLNKVKTVPAFSFTFRFALPVGMPS